MKTLVQRRIAELVAKHGSYRAAGAAIGVDYAYLYRLFSGERDYAREDVLRRLGLARVITYRRLTVMEDDEC